MVMREVANLNDSFTRSISRRFYLSAKKKKNKSSQWLGSRIRVGNVM